MNGCKECYRRERRELGLCLKCDRPAKPKPSKSPPTPFYTERYLYCDDHMPVRKAKKKLPVKKHVLSVDNFLKAKEMLNAEVSMSKRTIGQLIGVSERTIRRVANGEYDSYFKTTAKRNAAASAGVNGQS